MTKEFAVGTCEGSPSDVLANSSSAECFVLLASVSITQNRWRLQRGKRAWCLNIGARCTHGMS